MENTVTSNNQALNGLPRFSLKQLTTGSFVVGILLFLLPFAELRCNDTVIASNTGIGMATGQAWKAHGLLKKDLNNSGENGERDKKLSGGMRDWPNILALIALLSAIGGLIYNIRNGVLRAVVSLSSGLLSAILLVAMMIRLNADTRSSNQPSTDSERLTGLDNIQVTVHYTPWLYLAIFLFLLAAYTGYKQHKQEENEAVGKSVDFEFQQKPGGADIPLEGNES